MELGYDLDGADDIRVELWQLLGWDPVFLAQGATDRLDLVAIQERAADAEARHVAAVAS